MDMRNPSVFRALGIQPRRELKDFLDTGENAGEMFVSACSDNLFIAGSTSPTQQASELLSSSRFGDLIHLLKKGTVDPVVLIDLPPVLLTDDALVVAPQVDAVLLVASEGYTARADLLKALSLLADFTVAGVALNRAVETTADYGYGYGYGYANDEKPAGGKEI